MNPIRSSMGRRQFLVAAGLTSTTALASGRLVGFIDPVFQTNPAMAEEKKGNIIDSSRYSHLMSPLKIGNVILKSRLFSTNATPHFLQGPENFPAEPSRSFAANLAKNGAAIVTPRIITNRVRKEQRGDSAHMIIYDQEDKGVQNYLDQLVEGIHCYGAKVSLALRIFPNMQNGGAPGPTAPMEELSQEVAQKLIDETVEQLKYYQSHGFDMATLQILQYTGGSKKREGFSVKLCKAIKKALGQDFLIAARPTMSGTSVEQQEESTSYKVEDIVSSAKQWEGLIDILQLMWTDTFMGFDRDKGSPPPTIRFAQAIKESGAKIVVAPNTGFQNLDENEEYIATGKTDMIAMGRAFIADWEYGKKAYEGRGEDVVPCLRCNKCHGFQDGPWISVCSVNPKLGIDSATRIIEAPTVQKKVAVIGGGPAGMKAAIVAAERGHKVTLYEKTGSLGGLLKHSDFSNFKWPLMDFKNWLIRQVKKTGVEVLLNTTVTPDVIKVKKYDAIMVAIGADPSMPKIPGSDGKNVCNLIDVYGKEKELGKDVLIVGSGAYGVETGIYLARAGHNVTLLAGGRDLVEPSGPHQLMNLEMAFRNMKNCSSIQEAAATRIADGKVFYKDASGGEKSVQADSVVLYSGLKAKQDEAMKYSGLAGQIFIIGECSGLGTGVQKCQRSAFFAASQI